jgi:hypothetical protein
MNSIRFLFVSTVPYVPLEVLDLIHIPEENSINISNSAFLLEYYFGSCFLFPGLIIG